MTSTDLATAGRRAPSVRHRGEPDILSPSGARITASAARKLIESVPRNSRDARTTRWLSYSDWCDAYGWESAEGNALVSYLSDLGDRGHPSKTLEAHFGTLRALRAVQGTPVADAEVTACLAIIRHRAGEEADDPLVEPGPLQADGVDLDELRLMVRTLDRTTVRGKRDAATLIIDWWMAGRASEPARLNLHDVKITTVKVTDKVTGAKVSRRALIIKIRRSKADQGARGQEVRILAQDDAEICPVHATLEWLDVLADDGQLTPGPFLRRIDRHGTIGAKGAGRHTKDPLRRGGITADTVNTIIKTAARAAELVPAPTPDELAAAAAAQQEAYEAARKAESAEEANLILKAWRTAKRAARAAVRCITGHSMRRGCIQAMLDAGNPPEVVAVHSRHSPRSAAFDAYRKKKVSWAQNPTATLGLTA
ncbi:integrase [Streptomyces sp. NPDC058417]|uniref:integrase n=1 Tax=unclassified Streptomyces TaxID=2593676 RepID=UPI00365F7F78